MPELSRAEAVGAARAALVVVGAALAVVVLYVVFVRTTEGQSLDQVAFDHLGGGSLDTRQSVSSVLDAVSIGGMAVGLAACVAVALARSEWALATGAVVLVGGAIGTTELLKHHLLIRPDLGNGTLNSFPSGHTTVMVSLVMAALLVVPRGGRTLVALAGSVGVAVTGVSTIVASWHRPSDVVAALAVTLAWGAAVLVGLALVGRTEVSDPPLGRVLAAAAALPVAAAVIVALGVRPDGTTSDLAVHVVIMSTVAILGAAVVALYTTMVDTRLH